MSGTSLSKADSSPLLHARSRSVASDRGRGAMTVFQTRWRLHSRRLAMRDLRLRVPAALSVLAIAVVITNAAGQNDQENPRPLVPKTWDDRAMATLQVPLAHASVSPIPVSADYY